MDTENITIFEDDLLLAQELCASISDSNIRNRAVANIVAAKIASRFFNKDYQTDIETGLHNVPSILEKFDISDIYVNNSYIDVRVYFTCDELSVPKSQFDLGMLPVLYMFIKIKPDLSGGAVVGFIKPENVDKEHLMQDYYYISENSLESFYNVESNLKFALDVVDVPSELIYRYIDGSLDDEAQVRFLQELIKSKSSRIKLAKIIKAQTVFNSVLFSDSAVSEPNENDLGVAETQQEEVSTENSQDTDSSEAVLKTEEEELLEALDYTTEVTPSNAELLAEDAEHDAQTDETSEAASANEEIEALFNGEQEGVPAAKKKNSNAFVVLLLLLMLLAGGYFAYTNYAKMQDSYSQNALPELSEEVVSEPVSNPAQEEAMPVETVEAVSSDKNKQEEAVAVAIPAIEKHLDASVLVSNLRVEWEIPAGYTNNSAAKRYLYKLGKIIQLNLRSDLLLLSKPPLANRITVELRFNSDASRFEFVGIKDSSGERTVDATITDTVKNALNSHINSNTDTFGKLQGNPILIIRL